MENTPGLCKTPDKETQNYIFNHTMLRVRDPEVSLDFYSRVLGMKLLRKVDFNEWKFSLYFLAMQKELSREIFLDIKISGTLSPQQQSTGI